METLEHAGGSFFERELDYDPRKLIGTTTIHG
jgi:hypothetical protein